MLFSIVTLYGFILNKPDKNGFNLEKSVGS